MKMSTKLVLGSPNELPACACFVYTRSYLLFQRAITYIYPILIKHSFVEIRLLSPRLYTCQTEPIR